MSDSFATPGTVAHQAPLSIGFPKLEYRSGLPFPSPGDLPDPGFKPASPALAEGFFTPGPPEKPCEKTQSLKLLTLPLMVFSDSSVGKKSACNAGDPGSIPGSGISPGEEIGCPLQYFGASLVAQLVKNPSTMQETWA